MRAIIVLVAMCMFLSPISVAQEAKAPASAETRVRESNERIQEALAKRDYPRALEGAEALCVALRELAKPSATETAALVAKAVPFELALVNQILLSLRRSNWAIGMELGMADFVTLGTDDVVQRFDSWVAENPDAEDRALYRKFREPIGKALRGVVALGGAGDGFLWEKKEPWVPPLAFVAKDGDLCAVVSDYASGTTFNTLRSEAKGRAWKVLNKTVLASCGRVAEAFDGYPVQRIGFVVAYGSKDFGDRSAGSMRSEVVLILIPTELCKAFSDQKVTDQELLDGSETFLADRDNMVSFKKVRLKAE
jgi:hypothetical protein